MSEEELIIVSEDSCAKIAEEPPEKRSQKTIARISYEVLIENPYKYTESEFFHEVHIVRRKRPELNIGSYLIKRSPLVQKYGWGIHRNKEGKLALIPMESSRYKQLQKSIKTKKGWRSSNI